MTAVIIQESGAEKLRYLVGSALVITRDHCEYFNILNLAIDEACKLLGNPEWTSPERTIVRCIDIFL